MLLTRLTLRQVDGTLTTSLIGEDDLRGLWDGAKGFDELLAGASDFRLLRTTSRSLDEDREERFVSLGHDALAKVAQPWKQELERRAEQRRWQGHGALAAAIAVISPGYFGRRAAVDRATSRHTSARYRRGSKQQRKLAEDAGQKARDEAAGRRAGGGKPTAPGASSSAMGRVLDQGSILGSLVLFAEALSLDQGDSGREEMHRRRWARSCSNVERTLSFGSKTDQSSTPSLARTAGLW